MGEEAEAARLGPGLRKTEESIGNMISKPKTA